MAQSRRQKAEEALNYAIQVVEADLAQPETGQALGSPQQGQHVLQELRRMRQDLLENSPNLHATPGMGKAMVDSYAHDNPVALAVLSALNAVQQFLKRRGSHGHAN